MDLSASRHIDAEPTVVWEILADAYTLPRWWPRVSRVENVLETGFTEVMFSKRGRPIRLDHNYTEVEEPTHLTWELQVADSAFDRVLNAWTTRFSLDVESGGTRVAIAEHQVFRGSFRTGSIMQRRAARRRLEAALDGLAGMV